MDSKGGKKKPGVAPVWLLAAVAMIAVVAWGVTSSLRHRSVTSPASVTVPAESADPETAVPEAPEPVTESAAPEGMRGTG